MIKIFKNLIISISYMQFSRYIDDNEDSLSSGEYEIRTRDLLLARQALSQLSYTPVFGCDQLSRSTLQQSEDVLTPSKPYSAFDVS